MGEGFSRETKEILSRIPLKPRPQRLAELHRLGFVRCIVPRHGSSGLIAPEGMQLIRARTIREAMDAAIA